MEAFRLARPKKTRQQRRRILQRLGGETDPERYRAPPPGARDRTAALQRLRDGTSWDAARVAAAFARIRPRLEGVRFLFMPCYLADFLRIPKRLKLSDYFDAQAAALSVAGLKSETVAVNSQDTIARNAETLRAHLAGSRDRVFIISHSKGGLDTLDMLLGSEPETLARIVGWLPFQAPFAGAPLADRVAQIEPVRRTAESLLTAFGGSGGSLRDLCSDVRAEYMARNAAAIRRVTRAIPTLAVTTAIDAAHSMRQHPTATYPSLLWMRRQGIRSDGIVPTNSAILPHTPYAVLAPVDHTGTVSKGAASLSFRNRVLLTQALVAVTLEADAGTPSER